MKAWSWVYVQGALLLWGWLGVLLADQLAGWVLPYLLVVTGIAIYCGVSLRWVALQKIFQQRLLTALILLVLWALWARGIWGTRIDHLPPLWSYVPFSLLWVWLVIGFIFSISPVRLKGLVQVVGQGVFTLLIVIILLEIFLRLFVARLPQDLIERSVFLPRAAQNNPDVLMMPPQAPIKRYELAGKTSRYTLYNTDGDLYNVSCLKPPSERQALYEVNVTYNDLGFRETTSGQADLVVAGDSFTLAAWTPEPYWMNIVPNVLAMGVTGSGSLEQAMLIEAFAAARHPKVIVMAFFEGNDLQDTWRFAQALERYRTEQSAKQSVWQRNAHLRPLRFLSAYAAGLWTIDQIDTLEEVVYGACPYPVMDAYGNELAFYDDYIAMSTVDTEILRHSDIFATTTAAIQQAAVYAQSIESEFVLMFIPTTFHAHWQGILEAGLLPSFGEHVPAFQITSAGFEPDPSVSPAEVTQRLEQNIDNQRTLLAEFAAQEGILFLDLTPSLQAIAAQGQSAYSFADTHWSNEGHGMVREILRQFLQEFIPQKSD